MNRIQLLSYEDIMSFMSPVTFTSGDETETDGDDAHNQSENSFFIVNYCKIRV